MDKQWHIWVEIFDPNREKIGAFVSLGYKYKQNAVRAARNKYNKDGYKWTVAQDNPLV
jgi:hypothetical protein